MTIHWAQFYKLCKRDDGTSYWSEIPPGIGLTILDRAAPSLNYMRKLARFSGNAKFRQHKAVGQTHGYRIYRGKELGNNGFALTAAIEELKP